MTPHTSHTHNNTPPLARSASILDNITMGSGASSDAVKAAARAAHALDFVEALPEGFATRLGDGGSQLSGGQLQRLAVARAMLRSPRVRSPLAAPA